MVHKMNEISAIQRRLPLLPDLELLRLIDQLLDQYRSARHKNEDRAERIRFSRQIEVISREIRARGIHNPPWWASRRDWEVEEGLPAYSAA